MHVAPLTAADVAPCRALMLEAYASAPDAFTSTPEERAQEPDSWWTTRLADPSGLTVALGAFDDDRLAGTVTLEFSARSKTRHKGRLVDMYVRPEARSSCAGRPLVRAAMAYAAARSGVEVRTITVTHGNAPAESLYRSVGFELFGVEPMAIRTESGYLAKVHVWAPRGGCSVVA